MLDNDIPTLKTKQELDDLICFKVQYIEATTIEDVAEELKSLL
jgi:hypothetical protein